LLAVIKYETGAPSAAATVVALLMIGTSGSVTVNVSAIEVAPSPLLALRLMTDTPAAAGVPEIIPVV